MRAWLLLLGISGCTDPSLDKAAFHLVSPEYSYEEPFGRSYSRSSAGGATIGFFRDDFERASGPSDIFCSDILGGISGVSLIRIDLTERGQANTGTVPLSATLDPAVASASLTSPIAVFDRGSVELTDVDNAIVGTFSATGVTESGGTATFTGSFDATRCD